MPELAREHFIPVRKADLLDKLCQEPGLPTVGLFGHLDTVKPHDACGDCGRVGGSRFGAIPRRALGFIRSSGGVWSIDHNNSTLSNLCTYVH